MKFDIDQYYETKFAHGARWLKIYHHQRDKGFFTKNNVYHQNKTGIYSMLDQVTDVFRLDGKYEFLYEIPDYDIKTSYNRWRQTKFPTQETKKNDYVDGFQPIHLSFESIKPEITGKIVPFTGLALSESSSTLIDGTAIGRYWFFAIGIMEDYYQHPNAFPAYGYDSEVVLWVRIKQDWGSHEINVRNLISFLAFSAALII